MRSTLGSSCYRSFTLINARWTLWPGANDSNLVMLQQQQPPTLHSKILEYTCLTHSASTYNSPINFFFYLHQCHMFLLNMPFILLLFFVWGGGSLPKWNVNTLSLRSLCTFSRTASSHATQTWLVVERQTWEPHYILQTAASQGQSQYKRLSNCTSLLLFFWCFFILFLSLEWLE